MILWKIGTPGFEILEKSFFLVMARETVSNRTRTEGHQRIPFRT